MSDDILSPKKILLGQAKALGLKVDARWSVDTLAEHVLEAQESKEERDLAAIHEASDTWVLCIRDCWLGTEKQRANSVIKAPKELYNNWKATGAARLADQDEVSGV
jgi:hypothetical protein